jgi:hypothetical protein
VCWIWEKVGLLLSRYQISFLLHSARRLSTKVDALSITNEHACMAAKILAALPVYSAMQDLLRLPLLS